MSVKPVLKFIIPLLILASSILGAVALTLTKAEPPKKSIEIIRPFVEVQVAQLKTITFEITSQGIIKPRTETVLVSEVSGTIVETVEAFVVGGFFNKGDLLLRIDPRNYQTAIKNAQAQIAKVRTLIATESALGKYALQDWQRLKTLDAVVDKKASILTLRKPQMNEAKAELTSALANLAKAEEDLARTMIRAPYTGMIRNKRADLGQFVNPSTPLVEIFAVDYAEIRLPLKPFDIQYMLLPNSLKPNTTKLEIELVDTSFRTQIKYKAYIDRTEGVLDPDNRVLYAVAKIPDPYGFSIQRPTPLRIGSYVEARIQSREFENIVSLPRQALYNGDVWVVDAEHKLRRRTVKLLRTTKDQIFVTEGLEAGEIVCITALLDPLPGMLIRIVGAEESN